MRMYIPLTIHIVIHVLLQYFMKNDETLQMLFYWKKIMTSYKKRQILKSTKISHLQMQSYSVEILFLN